MAQHFIHYLPRRVASRYPADPCDPWFSEVQELGAGFRRPRYHVTRRRSGPATRVAPGDTIWLVSQLRSPWGDLPPSLDARVEVAEVARRKKGFRYAAGSRSKWLPLADASRLLAALESVDAAGNLSPVWRDSARPVGHSLQSIRMLASPRALEAWERRLDESPLHFISYRVRDGTRPAFHHACALMRKRRAAIFWDRWSLPRRLAERRELVSDPALDRYLTKILDGADKVWGVESPLYGARGSYSRRERERALARNTYARARLI